MSEKLSRLIAHDMADTANIAQMIISSETPTRQVAGIDFGTSNSSIGFWQSGSVELVNFGGDGVAIPTAVFYADEDAQRYYGKAAVSAYRLGTEGRLLRSLKSVLGSSLIQEKTTIRNRRVAFTDIILDFFVYLKTSLDSQQHNSVEQVVLGRPVHFVDENKEKDNQAEQQLRDIALNAGFRHVEFQFEPIAAALAFEQQLDSEQLAMVVDIGGGTADFTLIRLSPERRQNVDRSTDILSTVGVHIGGTDFDRSLSLRSVMPSLGMGGVVKGSTRTLPSSVFFDLATWHRIPLLYNVATQNLVKQLRLDAAEPEKLDILAQVLSGRHGHELAAAVEQAKIELSEVLVTQYAIPGLSQTPTIEVARSLFEQSIQELMDKLIACIRQGVANAGVKCPDITRIFYTGGTSSIPVLQHLIEKEFPSALVVKGDKFASVGVGLTLDAARRFNG